MLDEFLKKLQDLSRSGEGFVVATVIETQGSASARAGSKAIIDSAGTRVFGWVGGGCAESAVQFEALQSLTDGQTRIIALNLDDELLGVGMPCGGHMRVYIEPYLPKPKLLILGHGRIAETLAELGHTMGFCVTVNDPAATEESFPKADQLLTEGAGYGNLEIGPNSYVVVATQHKGDHLSMAQALEGNAPYVALIASKKRAQLVIDYLAATGVPREKLSAARVHAPAGLDLGAQTPEEIALSVISEIVAVRRSASCRPLAEVKGVKLSDEDIDVESAEQSLSTCAPMTREL
jgi:xanthine dehydrogenase accessory factor